MGRLDFGLGLVALAVLVATVAVIAMSSRDSTPQATAQETTVTLTTAASPVGCATTAAQLSSDTSTVSPGSEWTFPKSSYVKVRAYVAEGCTFSHWELDYGDGVTFDFHENPARFLMTEGMTATAHLTVPKVCTQTTLGQAPAQVPALAKDCNILMAAKDALRGTGTLNWSAATAMTGWDGVTVSGTPSRVTGLALSLRGLTGSVPAKLGALSALRSLDLSWNKLTGSIPATLGDLGEMRSLSLFRTSLGGSIPPELGDLAKLEQLSLSQSFLSGTIPAEFGKLTNLEGLYLYQNRLTGPVPKELGSLSSLENLVLSSNRLDGAIPVELGNLTALTSLRLDQNQLTGDVPWDLARLTALTHIFLAGNTLTGCIPPAWAGASTSDLATLALPYCPAHGSLDTTGAANEAGSYAFMMEGEDDATTVVTTHEDLRLRASALVIHKSDASGASRATVFDSAAAGDTFEWRYSHDCWIGFRVTEVKPDPAGTEPRKLLGVRPYAYAYTGCSGPISGGAAARQVWRDLPVIGGSSVTVPTVVGAFQVIPSDWEGDNLIYGLFQPPRSYSVPMTTTDLATAQTLPHWRDLPEGWVFVRAGAGGHDDPHYGYCSMWTKGDDKVEVCGGHAGYRLFPMPGSVSSNNRVSEIRVINGYAVSVTYYTNIAPGYEDITSIYVHVFDADAQSYHSFEGYSSSLSGRNVEALVEVAKSVFSE